MATETIPVIDLGPYLAGAPGALDKAAKELRHALTEIGFYFIVNHGVPAAKIAAVAEKRMDGVGDYSTGLPLYEKAAGKGNVAMMPWADFGFDMYSMSIIASEKTMKEKPKQLRAFLEASYMGWRDVMANPKEAMEILKKRVPEVDVEVMTPNLMIGLGLMKTERYAKNGIGWIDEKKMCDSVDLVNTYMGLPKKVECKAIYSTEFFPKVEMPK